MARFNPYSRSLPGYDAWKTRMPEEPDYEDCPYGEPYVLSVEVIFDPTHEEGDTPYQVVYMYTDHSHCQGRSHMDCEDVTEYVDFAELPSDAEKFQEAILEAFEEVCPGMTWQEFDRIKWYGSLA